MVKHSIFSASVLVTTDARKGCTSFATTEESFYSCTANQQNQNKHVTSKNKHLFPQWTTEGNWFQTNERRYLGQKKNILYFIKSH